MEVSENTKEGGKVRGLGYEAFKGQGKDGERAVASSTSSLSLPSSLSPSPELASLPTPQPQNDIENVYTHFLNIFSYSPSSSSPSRAFLRSGLPQSTRILISSSSIKYARGGVAAVEVEAIREEDESGVKVIISSPTR